MNEFAMYIGYAKMLPAHHVRHSKTPAKPVTVTRAANRAKNKAAAKARRANRGK